MSVYLGHVGRLVELKGPSSHAVDVEDGFTFDTTLEGRVKAQSKPLRRRSWSVGTSVATPAEVGALASFAMGEWGRGPFTWVSADAPVTNMLTPGQSSCDPSKIIAAGVVGTGPLLTPDGWAGRSYTNSAPASAFSFGAQGAPVIPDQDVTASAYLVGAGAAVRIRWEDAAGAQISVSTGAAQGVAGIAKRCWVTSTPPAGAVQARVQAVDATQAARPALTWTSELFEWADGHGCPTAVVSELRQRTVLALRGPHEGRFTDASFLVTEVG